jgi:uncharacterized damage-inducible protein DinB
LQASNELGSSPSISLHALLRYNELETLNWEQWFRKQPKELMELPAADAIDERATVRDLLFHIFLVEWTYARVLREERWENEWQKLDRSSCTTIFRIPAETQPKLRAFVGAATEEQLERNYTITAGRGRTITGTGRKFLAHIVIHSTRHWAQMAACMRQHGYKTDWLVR